MHENEIYGFRVDTLRRTENPQQLVWLTAHQCVIPHPVHQDIDKAPDEARAGELVIKHLLAGHRGHYSPLEMPSITFACSGFPHSVIAQLTRHRLAAFAVQSQRYTSEGVEAVARGELAPERVFYWRPGGTYVDREGTRYTRTPAHDFLDREFALLTAQRYLQRRQDGAAEEEARGLLMQDIRQNFVLGVNLRSLMHILTVRGKADAQLEIQLLAALLLAEFHEWAPEIAGWYEQNLWRKGRLAP